MKSFYKVKNYAVVTICTHCDNACIEGYFKRKRDAKNFIKKYFPLASVKLYTYATIIKTYSIYFREV